MTFERLRGTAGRGLALVMAAQLGAAACTTRGGEDVDSVQQAGTGQLGTLLTIDPKWLKEHFGLPLIDWKLDLPPIYFEQPIVPTSEAGAIEGRFVVSPDGAASYGVAIEVPPGRLGIEPSLTLAYSSGDDGGGLGVGWSLAGLPRLHRCAPLLPVDGRQTGLRWDKDDPLCEGGERLVLVKGLPGTSGAEYRKRENGFDTYVLEGDSTDPAGRIRLYYRDGRIASFGGPGVTSVAGLMRASAVAGTLVREREVVVAWPLARLEDRAGNAMTVTWERLPGDALEQLPREIRYTDRPDAPGDRFVRFAHAPRADRRSRWQAGVEQRSTHRLEKIETRAPRWGGTSPGQVMTYAIGYVTSPTTGRELVDSLTQCDRFGACLPPTRFQYEAGSHELVVEDTGVPVHPSWFETIIDAPVETADLDGDGRDDLILDHLDPDSIVHRSVYLARPGAHDRDHFGGERASGLPGSVAIFSDALLPRFPFAAFMRYLDVDHQGGRELVFEGGTSRVPQTYRWASDGFVLQDPDLSGCGANFNGGTTYGGWAYLADLDGNGADDVVSACVSCDANGSCPAADWGYRLQTGSTGSRYDEYQPRVGAGFSGRMHAFRPAPVDVDGDGRDELLVARAGDSTYRAWGMAPGGGFREDDTNLAVDGDAVRNVWIDVNGDGLADVVQLTTGDTFSVRLNTGRGFAAAYLGLAPGAESLGYADRNPNDVRVVDYNGDGRQDLLVLYERGRGRAGGDDLVVHLSDGERFATHFVGDPGVPTASRTVVRSTLRRWAATQTLDVDGDGLVDLIAPAGTGGHLMLHRHQGGTPDKLLAVRDGVGGGVGVAYARLHPGTDAYRGGGPTCKYPLSCQTGMLAVRASFDVDAPERRRTEYEYEQARTDLGGRDFLGFGIVRYVRPAVGLTHTTTYSNRLGSAGRFFYDHLPASETALAAVDLVRGRLRTAGYKRSAITYADGRTLVRLEKATIVEDEVDPWGGSTRIHDASVDYTNDEWGKVTREVETTSEGRVTTRWLEVENRAESRIYGLKRRIKTRIDAPGAGRVERTTAFEHDPRGLLGRVITAPGGGRAVELSTSFSRGADGQIDAVTWSDTTGRVRESRFGYDAQRVLATSHTRGALTERFELDPGLGMVTAQLDAAGVRRLARFDGVGRAVGAAQHPSHWATVAYERGEGGRGLVVRTVAPGGRSARIVKDAHGDVIERGRLGFDGGWKLERFERDERGLVRHADAPFDEADGAGEGTRYEWDHLGRLREQTVGGATTRVDWAGRVQTITDPLGHRRTLTHDDKGRVVRSCRSAGEGHEVCQDHVWDGAGKLRRVTDDEGRVWGQSYDARGRATSAYGPDVGWTAYVYDAFGDLVERQWNGEGTGEIVLGPLGPEPGSGPATVHVYFDHDEHGRVHRIRSDEDGETSFEWDTATNGLGKLAAATAPDGTRIEYGYSTVGQRILERTRVFGETIDIGYEYDDLGRLDRIVYPHVAARGAPLVVAHQYADSGDLKAVVDVATGATFWTLDAQTASGQVRREWLGNGTLTEYEHDEATGRTRGVRVSHTRYVPDWPWGHFATDDLLDLRYSFDDAGRLEHAEERVQGWQDGFTYDPLDRLDSHTRDGATASFGYDDAGNLTFFEGRHQCYGEDGAPAHGLSSVADEPCGSGKGDAYRYDRRGRQVEAPGRRIDFTWFDLPRRVERDGLGEVELAYDPLQQRAGKRHAGGDTISVAGLYERVREGDDVTHVFTVQGVDRPVAQVVFDEPTSDERTTYLHADRQGSITLVTDEAAGALTRYRYTPFGRRSTDGDEPGTGSFTGHRFDDELDLVDMRGRVYDPKIGRFLSADPVLTYPYDRQDYNAYSYALNDPLRFTDPSGWQECDGTCPPEVVDSDSGAEDAAWAAVEALLAATGPQPEGSGRDGAPGEDEPPGIDWDELGALLLEDSNMVPTFLAGMMDGAGLELRYELFPGLFEPLRPLYRRTYEGGRLFGSILGLGGDALSIIEGLGLAGGSAGGGLLAAGPSGGTSLFAGAAGVVAGWGLVVAGAGGVVVHGATGIDAARELYTLMGPVSVRPGQFATPGTAPATGNPGALSRALGTAMHTGDEAHHLIPSAIVEAFHDFFTEIGFITNGRFNGLPLPNTYHRGYHRVYNQAMARVVRDLAEMGLPVAESQLRIARLQARATMLLEMRIPLYARALGIESSVMRRWWYFALRTAIE